MKITKSKRLWMLGIWSTFTAVTIILAIYKGMENLAIAGIGVVNVVIGFYLKYETERPSNH